MTYVARKHGHTSAASCSPTYNSWRAMIERCTNKNNKRYDRYGGRGIKVCAAWATSFATFLEDMGERPAGCDLDRIDNDGNYNVKNCQWLPRAKNSNKTSRTRYITANGKTQSLADWSRETGTHHFTIADRLNRGWSPENAVLGPHEKKPPKTINGGNSRYLSCRGKTLKISHWAKVTGIKAPTISRRLQLGWSVEKALGAGSLEE